MSKNKWIETYLNDIKKDGNNSVSELDLRAFLRGKGEEPEKLIEEMILIGQLRRSGHLLLITNKELIKKIIIIYVHGFRGGATTFGNMPEYVRAEIHQKYSDVTIINKTIEYKTVFFPFVSKNTSWENLSLCIKDEIDTMKADNTTIHIVGHSAGGLIIREAMSTSEDILLESGVKSATLIATPNNGSGLANVGTYLFPWQTQLKELCRNSSELEKLNNRWNEKTPQGNIKVLCLWGEQDQVVTMESAVTGMERVDVRGILNADHTNIVKPKSRSDLIVKYVVGHIIKSL